MEYIITFKNTNHAVMAERCLLDEGLNVTVLPLPSQISAGCGICLKLSRAEAGKALGELRRKDITAGDIFAREKDKDNRYSYKKIDGKESLMERKLGSLLDKCTSGGCGAKISPGELSRLLTGLPVLRDENLLVGFGSSDDAGVYKISEKQSIVTTADFFPPMVDDPKTFGRIAAANALSDVYTMGGVPVTALNLVCFPQSMDTGLLADILTGGAEKIMEASAVLAGGHSIYDKEPKYGLAVTGIVDNDKILRNNTPGVSHKLILTKPIGTGLIMAALRGGVASETAINKATASMERLNRYAMEKARGFSISACTDVTGFGLLAHALEMASGGVSIVIYPDELPYFEEAYIYAGEYLMTAAGQRNRNFCSGKADVSTLPPAMQEIVFDPQTSGGCLIACNPDEADEMLAAVREAEPCARVIGEIISREKDTILFRY